MSVTQKGNAQAAFQNEICGMRDNPGQDALFILPEKTAG